MKVSPARILIFFIVLIVSISVWCPLWFVATGAITSSDELLATLAPAFGSSGTARWHFLPTWPTGQHIVALLFDTPQYFVMFWNTVKQVAFGMVGQFIVGTPAAWALSRFHFRGRRLVRALYIMLMLLPFQVMMLPDYLVLERLGFLNSSLAIILPMTFSTFPVFIMMRGFNSISSACLEAAALDGASPLQTFFRIGIPLGLPGIFASLTFNFLEGWSAVEQPLAFLKDPTLFPLSLYFSEIEPADIGSAMAASLFMLLPAVLVFNFGQEYLALGLSEIGSAAVKG